MTAAAMTIDQPLICNGVNVTQMVETIVAVKADPTLARFTFRAANEWLGGASNRSTIKSLYGAKQEDTTRQHAFTLDADEPLPLLGQDKAPNPIEILLHALAACMTTTLTYHAALRGIAVKAIDSRLEGEIDLRGTLELADDVRIGPEQVRVHMRVKSGAPAPELAKLAKLSPVYDVVSRALPVDVVVATY